MTLKLLAAGLAAALAAVAVFGATEADAQTRRQRQSAVRTQGPNVSYMAGPRTRVYVTKRSWLDAGTEVSPGERKFSDYAFPPGYCASCASLPRNPDRSPLSNTPFDLGGYPARFPLY